MLIPMQDKIQRGKALYSNCLIPQQKKKSSSTYLEVYNVLLFGWSGVCVYVLRTVLIEFSTKEKSYRWKKSVEIVHVESEQSQNEVKKCSKNIFLKSFKCDAL